MTLKDQVKLIKSKALIAKRNDLQQACNGIYGTPASLRLLDAIEIIDTELRTRT